MIYNLQSKTKSWGGKIDIFTINYNFFLRNLKLLKNDLNNKLLKFKNTRIVNV